MNTVGSEIEKPTKLSNLIGRIGDMSISLLDSRSELNRSTDNLIGDEGPDGDKCCENTIDEHGGAIGLLENKVNGLDLQINEIKNAVKRIINSGII